MINPSAVSNSLSQTEPAVFSGLLWRKNLWWFFHVPLFPAGVLLIV